jgi:CheY-like chemotaxis protein
MDATGLRVLVIDDDEDFSASVQSLLEAQGCAVRIADSGEAGLREVTEFRPHVIVLDIMMESTTEGYVVNQRLKFGLDFAEFQDIPIVMVSSIESSPDELYPWAGELPQIRPDWYLTKPLDIGRFLEVVEKAAARGFLRA